MSFISPGANIHRGDNLILGDTGAVSQLGWSRTLTAGPIVVSGLHNQIATVINNSNGNYTVSTAEHVGGKWYAEIQVNAVAFNHAPCLGIAGPNANSPTAYAGALASQDPTLPAIWISQNGLVMGFQAGLTAYNIGDVINLACDLDAHIGWIGLNGAWFAGNDPSTGINPNISGSALTFQFGRGRIMTWNENGGVSQGSQQTIRQRAGDFTFPIPVGFTAWGPST